MQASYRGGYAPDIILLSHMRHQIWDNDCLIDVSNVLQLRVIVHAEAFRDKLPLCLKQPQQLVPVSSPNMIPVVLENSREPGMLRGPAAFVPAGGAPLQDSNEQWSRVASSFEADISQQPALLQGGQLRDYQMKVT